jgi:hypothetical protein
MPMGSGRALEEECGRSEEFMRVRFEQAKINFLDNFLPESMRIGNNSYNFWKYMAQKKNNQFLRVL